jgi:hypothetical protein
VQHGLDGQVRQIGNRESGGSKEQALILINEVMDSASKKKLELIMQKQFFELNKYLADLHTAVALERVIHIENIKTEHRDKLDEAQIDFAGDALDEKIQELMQDK